MADIGHEVALGNNGKFVRVPDGEKPAVVPIWDWLGDASEKDAAPIPTRDGTLELRIGEAGPKVFVGIFCKVDAG